MPSRDAARHARRVLHGDRPATGDTERGPIGEEQAALTRAEAVARAVLMTSAVDPAETEQFAARLRRWWPDLWGGLRAPYADHPRRDVALDELVRVMAPGPPRGPRSCAPSIAPALAGPDWFQEPSMIGYVFYADRFAGHPARAWRSTSTTSTSSASPTCT